MRRKIIGLAVSGFLLAISFPTEAQQAKLYRIGVLLPGTAWSEIIDGLRLD